MTSGDDDRELWRLAAEEREAEYRDHRWKFIPGPLVECRCGTVFDSQAEQQEHANVIALRAAVRVLGL